MVVVVVIFIFIFWGYPESLPPPLSRRGYELGGCGGVFSPARICNPYYISPSLSLSPPHLLLFLISLQSFFFYRCLPNTERLGPVSLYIPVQVNDPDSPYHSVRHHVSNVPSNISCFIFFIIILIFWLLIQFHVCVANFIAIAKTKFVSFSDYV